MSDFMDDLLVVHGHLMGLGGGVADDEDVKVKDAWNRLRLALLPPHGVASPPGRCGVAYDGAVRLAEHLYRMGCDEGGVLLRDSVGMERLVFRLVGAVEALHDVANEVLAVYEGATAQNAPAWGRRVTKNGDGMVLEDGVFDLGRWVAGFEEHQVSYCDECGAELEPNGRCVMCQEERYEG